MYKKVTDVAVKKIMDVKLGMMEDDEEYEEESESIVKSEEVEDKVYIRVIGQINNETYESVSDVLLSLIIAKNESDIVILIDSNGGMLRPTFGIVNLLKSMNNKITTIAFNLCASAACIIFAAGEERYMLRGTEYMLHQLRSILEDTYKVSDLKELACNMDELTARYKGHLLNGSSIDEDFLNTVLDNKEDTILTEEQLVKFGIVTKIFDKFSEIL
ncbi:MAG: ATP-dependent Clp protease proteolytic subunit [Clostridia bacterium]|nr:ATP-dependent Clp protease proteolytic subunit [Clostridia bacterium]